MNTDNEELLDLCIDTCAEFEKKTGMKTKEIHSFKQKDLSEKTGLSLKEVKKWFNAAKAALKLVSPAESTDDSN